MRFFWSFILLLGISGFAAAQTGPNSPAFERQLFAGQLGEISALALGADGSVYAADIGRGLIYKLADRGKDGQLDSRQVIASNFERPSGLAAVEGRLFVSDARAIWEVNPRGGDVRHVASLTNSQTLSAPRPIRASKDGASLILALTNRDKISSKIVSVDVETGAAELISSGVGQIGVLAGASDLWAASDGAIFPVYGPSYDAKEGAVVAAGTYISGFVLPSSDRSKWAGAAAFPDHIFTAVRTNKSSATFSRADVMRLYAVPTEFGKPSAGPPISMIGDIPSSRTRSGAALSGAMVMDGRGIFLADSGAGAVWRIVPSTPKLRPRKPLIETSELKPSAVPKAELNPKGSGLTSASTLTEGATLKVGSTIPEDDDEENENGDLRKRSPDEIITSSPETGDE